MSQWHHKQRDFSGGEISARMYMRADTEAYKKSVLEMNNFQPTIQGSARRMPGTRFLRDLGTTETTRIIPYLTTGNERSLIVLTPLAAKLLTNITDELEPGRTVRSRSTVQVSATSALATVVYREPLLPDPNMETGAEGWKLAPDRQEGYNGDKWLGVWWNQKQRAVRMSVRVLDKNRPDPDVGTMEAELDVTYPTILGTIDMDTLYEVNPGDGGIGNYEFTVVVSKSADYSNPIFEKTFTEDGHPAGSRLYIENENFPLDDGINTWTGTLYVQVKLTAERKDGGIDDTNFSNPQMQVQRFQVWADNETELTEEDLVTPYTADDLNDVHYVQSPYGSPDGYKEMVFTHPQHPPQRMYFDPQLPGYVWEAIPFVDDDLQPNPPTEWAVNNYPATCTSYHGRLVMAGGQTFKVKSGDPVASVSETVWTTDVGKWDTISDESEDINPDDSIEFTSVYRSPIQWIFGGKSLLIGSLEYEYSASGEGIFSPGDLGVFLHTTHGSANVQPAAFGEAVLYPADAGTKLRSMTYSNEQQSWVAQDLTILNPEICFPKIKRMARVRNPHQQCWVLGSHGTVSIYNAESGVQGWNTYQLNGGRIRDLCVVTDSKGRDVPMMVVQRNIEGTEVHYLEAIPNFVDVANWEYTVSSIRYISDQEGGTDTIPGLEHMEGHTVQVYDQYRFVGAFKVEGGQVVLNDQAGGTTKMKFCIVGMLHPSTVRLLPPEKDDPGAAARYTDFTVRTYGSTRPVINGERPPDRSQQDNMGLSPPPDYVVDLQVYDTGWSQEARPDAQEIEIYEQVPFACEILGFFAKLTANSL